MLWVAQFFFIPKIILITHAMKTLNFRRKILLALLMKKNMYLAGVSNAVRDDLRQSSFGIPKEQIMTLYNCIDMEKIEMAFYSRQTARTQLNILRISFYLAHSVD